MPAKHKLISIFILCLSFISLYLFLPVVLIRHRPDIANNDQSKLQNFSRDRQISFEINPKNNGLDSLSFKLKNPNLVNTSQISVQIKDNNHNLIHQQNLSARNVGDPDWLSFLFPPISKQFYPLKVNFSTDNPKPDELYLYTDHSDLPTFKTTFRPMSFSSSLDHQLVYLANKFNSSTYHLFSIFVVILVVLFLFT